ncbi:MAG: glycosyltransferase family 9 protein [Bacteroidales bacterium]|nr:glycosyltransferase family 9 protein [Bacteroidales bacterium]
MPKAADLTGKRIILSRTDSIGDVVLTLPMAGILKKRHPGCEILFLGKNYTREVVSLSENIDGMVDWDLISDMDTESAVKTIAGLNADYIVHVFPDSAIAKLAKKAGIAHRIGATGRGYHFLYCNMLVPLSRKRSDLHEAQLNTILLKPFGIRHIPEITEYPALYGLTKVPPPDDNLSRLIDPRRFNLILHPGSGGSAREWGSANFRKLAELLSQNKFNIFITGLPSEKLLLEREGFFHHLPATDLTGKMGLSELTGFINRCDGLVAASTGPLHLAAALGRHAIGIYPPIRPMHAGRWAPVGKNAISFSLNKKCNACRNTTDCECMRNVKPEEIASYLEKIAS